MPTPAWTRIIIFLAAAIWLVVSLIMGLPADTSWLRPLSITTSLVVLILLLFDLFIWRWLPYELTRMPNLRGTWQADLTSSYKTKDGKSLELKCFLVLRQTYSSIHIEMLFPDSESVSTSAAIVKTNGTPELWYSYQSAAHALKLDGNPPHVGATQLRISINKDRKLVGDYWTKRKTLGRIETSAHSPKLASDYKDAQKLFTRH